jgi:hypothetical protein
MLLLLLLQFSQNHARQYSLEKQKDRLENRLRRTEAAFGRAASSVDSSPALLPRIHRRGRITYTDGSAHQLLSGAVLRRPLPGSDALSFALAHPTHSLLVHTQTLQGQTSSLYVCLRDRSRTTTRRFRSVLGVSADGVFELRPPAQGFTISRPCFRLRLTSTSSLLFSKATQADLARVRLIVPIEAVETLYLDRSKSLRLVRSSGSSTIEHQPLVDGLRRLQISARLTPAPYRLAEVSVAFGAGRSDLTERIWLSSLARSPFDNFFFNRP